jgi:hypothetical protein
VEDLTNVVDQALDASDPAEEEVGGGTLHLSPLARDQGSLGPRGPKHPTGVGSRQHFGLRDLGWAPGARTQWPLGPQGPRWTPGARTHLQV